MSGDRPYRPVHGTVSDVAFVALPPTAVDAAAGPTRLIVAWPGFDPPRTARALAAALPMTGVPAWRIYVDLPGRPVAGLESGAILESEAVEAFADAVEQSVARLPGLVAELGGLLGVPDGPVGLAGFSTGGSAALLAVARRVVPVSAAAVVAPVVAPARAASAVERRAGRENRWTDEAALLAERLDLRRLAARMHGVPLLLVAGARDRVVPPREVTGLGELLPDAETATFRMGHALAAEPGTEALPPITDAVRVDGVLTDWFRQRVTGGDVPVELTVPDMEDAVHLVGHVARDQWRAST
ncbi:alpha/beta hydrolase [Spirillospora albida]|uniref:alpha/beta hydrolase n=1 Tax=Spirillospora albida TaxID=58123 RepID=UPI00068D2E33|nr:alpha/beta hydrolase [Spirillospora albida]